MKIIILEGIATSGKTSVRNELEKILRARNLEYVFVEENETLMPILHNKDIKVSIEYINTLLNKYIAFKDKVLVFDRLFLTHIWRVSSEINQFKESLEILATNNATICFLQIPEQNISERIKTAMTHRDEGWLNYVKTKGSTEEEVLSYYINQQKKLLDLLEKIPLTHKIFNTSGMDFKKIALEIADTI